MVANASSDLETGLRSVMFVSERTGGCFADVSSFETRQVNTSKNHESGVKNKKMLYLLFLKHGAIGPQIRG